MLEDAIIHANVRQQTGSRAMRRLRASGKIPAVIYGHKLATVPLAVDASRIYARLRHGAHGLLELDIDGARESAVIKALQWDVFGKEVLHVDFARVSKDERVTLEVPIILRGTAPGIAEGGVLEQPLHSLEIQCPAGGIQETIVVNVNKLHLGQSILVRDLPLAESVTTSAPPDQVVVQVTLPTITEEEAPPAAEAPAEPELIRREKAEPQEE
jgi:large subunit ribosomal protein L25